MGAKPYYKTVGNKVNNYCISHCSIRLTGATVVYDKDNSVHEDYSQLLSGSSCCFCSIYFKVAVETKIRRKKKVKFVFLLAQVKFLFDS